MYDAMYIHTALLTTNDTREILDLTWNYRAKWKFIGTELEIDVASPGTLDAIDANNKTVEDCLREMINHWLRSAKPKPTRHAITMALQSRCVSGTAGNCHCVLSHPDKCYY